MSGSFADDLLAEFAAEAEERLDHLEELLLALGPAAPAERAGILSGVKLELHTLKGNAGMMGLTDQQVLAHQLEDLTEKVDRERPAPETLQPLLAGVDRFRALLAETARGIAAPASAAEGGNAAGAGAPAAAATVAASSVRIPFGTLDRLVDQLAEVVIVRNRLADALAGLRPHLPRRAELRELSSAWEQLEETHDRLGTILDQLQSSVLHLRMVPLSTLFRHLSRIVHDTSAEEGKEVRFETAGADTPLDKALIELASEALGHLVRNAVIHGIEPPAERERAGKPRQGTLKLDAVASPREVRIDVLDDGGGVDRQAVVAAAARHGRDLLEGEDPLELLFLAGLSTREEAGLGAGRGIGLAAVREAVQRHGGQVEIASREGAGTLFRLHLPLSASITRALLLRCDGEDYALPLRSVVESLRFSPDLLHEMNGAAVLSWRGGVLPGLDLGVTFGTSRERRREGYAIVVEDAGRQRGLFADQVLGIREIVVKQLDSALGAPPGISGSTVLGDGRAVLILDPMGLLSLKLSAGAQEVPA